MGESAIGPESPRWTIESWGYPSRRRSDRPQRFFRPQRLIMKIKYFPDTDTALIEFTTHAVAETKEISENIYVDLDPHGNLVSMTIEHAKTAAAI